VKWTQGADGVEAQNLSTFGARDSGLETGDRLLSINGIPVRDLDAYTEVMELLAVDLPEGSQASYLVEKVDSQLERSFTLEVRLKPSTDTTDLLLALVALAYLVIGILVFLPNWQAQGSFHFYSICLVTFILFLYRYSGAADTFDIVIYWCSAVAFLLLPPLFLHFCLQFPAPSAALTGFVATKRVLYSPFAALLALHIFWFSGQLQTVGLPRSERVAHFLDQLHLAHFGLYFLVAVVSLLLSRQRADMVVHRLQMRWITWGTAAGTVPFLALYVVPFLWGWPISPYLEVSLLGFVLIPISFGYALTRHRLTDIKLIFSQGAAYVLVTSALLGMYVGIVLLIGKAVQDFSPDSGFVLFAGAALLVALVFAPLKDQVQAQIDRYFYQEEYGFRESLFEFGRTLSSEVHLAALIERLVTRIRQTFNVAPAHIFLRDSPQSNVYRKVSSLETGNGSGVSQRVPESFLSELDKEWQPLSLLPADNPLAQIREALGLQGLHYVVPLRVRGGIIGFWALGNRFNGELLSSADLKLIAGFSAYAAVAIDNALLYQSLEGKAGELAQLKAYSENVVESITLGVAVVSPEGEITVWNGAMESIYGLERKEVLGKSLLNIFPSDIIQMLQEVVEGPRWQVDSTHHVRKMHLKTSRAESRLVDMTLAPFILQEDIVTGTLLVFDDVTDKVQLENQLLQAEKLSSIGLLAAGIAHEVNTPLTGICSYTQMLLKETPSDDPRHLVLKKIEKQGFRASTIVDSLLNFAQVRDTDFQEVDINALMKETLSLVDHQLRKSRVETLLDLDPGLPGTWANGGKLQQVFMNLLLNSRDAMPKGGELRIKTYQENSQLVVRIEDSGMGISEENIKRIYDPFFTTKEIGKGAGLGLSVSYGIIQEHSGRINVESGPGQGTVFRIQFPVKRLN